MLWMLTMLLITGVILNIRKKRSGFVFWIVANGIWAIVDFKSGMWAEGALFVVYAILAVFGYFAWKKDGAGVVPNGRLQSGLVKYGKEI